MRGVGEVPGADRSPNILLREARDDSCRPGGITLGHAPERRIWVFAAPELRVEITIAEVSEIGRTWRSLRALPGSLNRAKSCKILEDIAKVQEVRVTERPRNGVGGPL